MQQCTTLTRLYELALQLTRAARQKVMPDDHSEVVPLLPIPNRTVKRLCADDSAGSRVKVGHCQANIKATARAITSSGVLLLGVRKWAWIVAGREGLRTTPT